jgi:hypothetical protein
MVNYRHIISIITVIFFSSCSNDFELIEDKKEIPVVYGLIEAGSENNYIRLERAFASPTLTPEEIAKNPDSLYYGNAVVKLIKILGNVKEEVILKRVDATSEGFPRRDGIFAKAPNYVYKISSSEMSFTAGEDVNLEIIIDEKEVIKAKTKIIQSVFPTKPNGGGNVVFSADKADQLKWNTNDENGGKIHSLEFRINYIEELNGVETNKTLIWPVVKNITGESYTLPANAFFTFLGANIKKEPGIKRYFKNLDFAIYSGDENLSNYLLVGQANTGITSSGEIPTFTNLSRGLGIFGSKAKVEVLGLGLNFSTADILKTSPLTKDLNFQ